MLFVFGFAMKGFLSNDFNVFGKNIFTQIIIRLKLYYGPSVLTTPKVKIKKYY